MNLKKMTAGILSCLQLILLLPVGASAAENYTLGDITGDGNADASDAAEILVDAAATGSGKPSIFTVQQLNAADTNKDGYADSADGAVILVYSALKGTGAVTDDLESYLEKNTANVDSLAAPVITVGKVSGGSQVKWNTVAYASGYEIYRYNGSSAAASDYKLIATVQGGSVASYTDAHGTSSSHCYKIRAYRNQPNGTIYSAYSIAREDWTKEAILQGADLTPHNTFTVYNKQAAETTSYEKTLTENDIALLEKFAAENFPANCTREDQLWITLQWIHKNVNYAYAGDLWNSIADKTWVEAIFVHKAGQCAQYNGALAAMMAYLGYDVSMVQGYRGTYPGNYWQHFWPEVEIADKTYMMECGNYGKSGDWYYFLCTYDQTSKYICNQKNMN